MRYTPTMRPHRLLWMTALTAVVTALPATPPAPQHLDGSPPDPLPAGLVLPPPAAPAIPTGVTIPLVRPAAATVTPDQRSIGALVLVPAAPDPLPAPAAPLAVDLPAPPRTPSSGGRPADQLWDASAEPPPPGTPPSGRDHASR